MMYGLRAMDGWMDGFLMFKGTLRDLQIIYHAEEIMRLVLKTCLDRAHPVYIYAFWIILCKVYKRLWYHLHVLISLLKHWFMTYLIYGYDIFIHCNETLTQLGWVQHFIYFFHCVFLSVHLVNLKLPDTYLLQFHVFTVWVTETVWIYFGII